MASPLRIAIVGLGRWGPVQLQAFATTPGARVTAVADLDPARLRAHCPPGATPSATLGALLERSEFDAVVLATPSATHARLAERALRAGRHVLVEKPLALCVAEGEHLVRLAAGRPEVAVMGHLLEHHAAVAALASLVESGDIGDLARIEARRLATRVTRDDPWWTLAPHDLGLCLRFAGAPLRIDVRRGGGRVRAEVTFASGVEAEIEVGFGAPRRVRELRLLGTRGSARLDDAPSGARVTVDTPSRGTRCLTFPTAELPLARQARAFVAACRGGPIPPRCGLQEGLAIVRCLAAAPVNTARPEAPTLQPPPSGSW